MFYKYLAVFVNEFLMESDSYQTDYPQITLRNVQTLVDDHEDSFEIAHVFDIVPNPEDDTQKDVILITENHGDITHTIPDQESRFLSIGEKVIVLLSQDTQQKIDDVLCAKNRSYDKILGPNAFETFLDYIKHSKQSDKS
jgi:hypothetical protein